MAAQQNRYPGVQPFRASQRHIFFGRDEDIENLYDLILLEKLVVLFGKSGYGKSSLLNAGVVPKLGDEKKPVALRFRPIEVRFGSYIEGRSLAPLETVRRIVEKEMPVHRIPAAPEASLWGLFKQRQFSGAEAGGPLPDAVQFVLVFDQFEEFFTYPGAQQQEFRRQLAELLFTHLPQYAREGLDAMDEAQRLRLVTPLNIKAVFAIRSDRMSLLDSMKDALPTILHRRYELKPLSRGQAEEAILKPAREGAMDESWKEKFLTPPFEFQPAALDAMLENLLTSESGGKGGVEAFLLQILCEHVEDLVKKGALPDLDSNGLPDITPAQLPKMSNLLGNYVNRKISELAPADQPVARRLLEDGLFEEDPATSEGRRTSVDGQSLRAKFRKQGLTQGILDQLEQNYLVRREPNTVGGFSYEISHDRLMEPLQKMKAERQKKQVARGQRRLIGLVAVAMAMAASAIAFGIWAFQQKKDADFAKKIALEKQRAAVRSDSLTQIAIADAIEQKLNAQHSDSLAKVAEALALEQAKIAKGNLAEMEKAQTARLKTEIDQYIASALRMVELKDNEMANHILDEAARLAKGHPALLESIEKTRPE